MKNCVVVENEEVFLFNQFKNFTPCGSNGAMKKEEKNGEIYPHGGPLC